MSTEVALLPRWGVTAYWWNEEPSAWNVNEVQYYPEHLVASVNDGQFIIPFASVKYVTVTDLDKVRASAEDGATEAVENYEPESNAQVEGAAVIN